MTNSKIRFFSFLATLATATISFALESYYVVNPLAAKGVVELEYSRAQGTTSSANQSGSNTGNIFKLNYSRRVSDWTLAGGSNFQSQSISSDNTGQTNAVAGLGDINFSAKSGMVFEPMTMTYGGLINLSPGPAQSPYTGVGQNKVAGNNFSGIQSLSPFIGAEAYVEEMAVGGRLVANIFSEQRVDYGSDSTSTGAESATSFHLEGFAEIPLYNKFDVGLVAGVGRKDLAINQYFQGGNEYTAQIYSQYKIEKGASVSVSLSSLTQKLPIEKSSNEIAVGFRKSL